MGDPDDLETKNIIAQYTDELSDIWIRYKKLRNSTELVLEAICETP